MHILEQLIPYWDLAEGFLLLIKVSEDENLEDRLLELIYDQVKKIQNKEKQQKIREQIQVLKQHNAMMEMDRKEAETLLDSLLSMMEE